MRVIKFGHFKMQTIIIKCTLSNPGHRAEDVFDEMKLKINYRYEKPWLNWFWILYLQLWVYFNDAEKQISGYLSQIQFYIRKLAPLEISVIHTATHLVNTSCICGATNSTLSRFLYLLSEQIQTFVEQIETFSSVFHPERLSAPSWSDLLVEIAL